jgi:hypothetical protein
MSVFDLALRTSARHVTRNLVHVPMRTRLIVALILAVGGFALWYVTEREVYYKVFEFSIAPFVDKVLFELGLVSEEA